MIKICTEGNVRKSIVNLALFYYADVMKKPTFSSERTQITRECITSTRMVIKLKDATQHFQ